LYYANYFSHAAFSLYFNSFTMVSLGVDLIVFILFGDHSLFGYAH
jgi:hypothetical protein